MPSNLFIHRNAFLFFLIIIFSPALQSQNACLNQVGAIYGSPQLNERGKCLIPAPDHEHFYLIGMIEDSVLIAWVDLKGEVLWAKSFDIVPGKRDNVSASIIDSDGMLVTVGIAGDYDDGGTIFAFRYDPVNQQVIWSKNYVNSSGRSYSFAVVQNPDNGNFILCTNPHTPLPGTTNNDELMEVDKNTGAILPAKVMEYDLGGSDAMAEIIYYQNFLFAAGRYTDGLPNNRMRNTIIKIDPATFDQVWVKVGHVPVDASARMYGKDLIIDQNNIFSLSSGDPSGTSTTNTKLYVQRMDLDGNLVWIKQYELPGSNDLAHQIIKSGNGFIVLATDNATNTHIDFIKINSDGNVIWSRQIQLPGVQNQIIDRGNAQVMEIGNNIFVTGTATYSNGSTDIILLKADPDGNSDLPCGGTASLTVSAQTVTEPTFYLVAPSPSNPSNQVINETSLPISTLLSPQCISTDTIETSVAITICEGESYEGYISTGTYDDYFTSSQGCDSLRTLALTVNQCDSAACSTVTGAVYGTSSGDEFGYSLAATPGQDGFYVSGRRGDSALIVKMNLFGEIIWSRTFDIVPNAVDHVGTVIVDSDGNLAMAGTAGDADLGGTIFACRYNPNSNQILWAKEYITNLTSERCFTLVQKDKGGHYILSSNPNDESSSNNDATLLEIDKNTGDIIPAFSKQYHLGGSESINEIVLHDQFIYGVGRYTDGPLPSQMRNTLVKIDPVSGHHEWVKLGHVAGNATARLYGFDLVIKDNAIYSGYHGDPAGTSTSNTKLYLQKTSLDGNLLWLKQYDLPGNVDFGFEIIASNNGLVVLAENRSTPRQLFMFKVNLTGDMEWAKTYLLSEVSNSDAYYYGRNQLIQIGNQLIFTGYGSSPDHKSEMIVARTDLNGDSESPCVISDNINIGVTNISNPVFYSVDVEESNAIHDIHSHQPIPAEILISPDEQCVLVDTIFTFIDAAICDGQQYEGYTQTGVYEDYFTSANGCDSLRTLSLTVIDCHSLLYYSLNACTAYMSNGSNMDYSEFTPAFPSGAGCANITATNLFRTPPQENKHSCTPGVNSSIGMCISALSSCTYLPGHQASLVTEINFNPAGDSIVRLTKLEFYERSPAMYSWINGGTGPNNYPKFYGIRVLKNGQEIYRMENIATHLNWTLQSFDFTAIEEFDINQPATIRIEILPYCPIGNGAAVSAWDIDEVNLFGGCLPSTGNLPIISGVVKTALGQVIPGATITLGKYASFLSAQFAATNSDGQYLFNTVDKGWKYYIKGGKNDNWLQGVNTLDLLRLQKHLLGIQPFKSLSQYIAADINHNEVINVMDILDLRRALLGMYSSFPNNTSWRIGIEREPSNSYDTEFDAANKLPPALNEPVIFDFMGVKIGDVNEDIDLGMQQNEIVTRGIDLYKIEADDIEFQGGTEISVPIKAGDDIQLEGLQLMFNSSQLELISIEAGKIPIQPEFYAHTSQGIISISWSQVEPVSVSKGDVLFTMTFSTHHPGAFRDEIAIVKGTLFPEVYSESETRSVDFSVSSKTNSVPGQCIAGVSIEPNPFTVTSTIYFEMMETSKVRFIFYDLAGQKLYEEEHEYIPGRQSLALNNAKLTTGEGLIYCQMIADDQVITKKLVKIR